MWIRLSNERMEIAAPCGCVQAFSVTPKFEIERSALTGRCGKSGACEYNYIGLLAVAIQVTACLRKARPYQPELTGAPVSSYDIGEVA